MITDNTFTVHMMMIGSNNELYCELTPVLVILLFLGTAAF
jgi:hypothetical protein